jgi:carbon storage regulator
MTWDGIAQALAGRISMLVLSRKRSERILIGSNISITVVKLEGNQVRLGIDAPAELSVMRAELLERMNPRDERVHDPIPVRPKG